MDWNRPAANGINSDLLHRSFHQLDLGEYLVALRSQEVANLRQIVQTPRGVQEAAWVLELLRRIVLDLNWIMVSLLSGCHCDMMRASDFEFLCAVHGPNPKMCSARAYSVHALDSAISQLTGE